MTDLDFIRAFEDCTLPGELFHHREHLRLAWLYLQNADDAAAEKLMEEGIRRYAASLGAAEKYHHTLTLFWVRAVSRARRETPATTSFEAFASAHPELLDKAFVGRHYSPALLESARARSGWVNPDRLPLSPV